MAAQRWNPLLNLRLGPKMALVPAIALLALVGTYLVTTLRLDAYEAKVKQVEQAEHIIALVREARVAEKNYLRRDDEEELQHVRSTLDAVDRTGTRIDELGALGPEGRSLLGAIQEASKRYRTNFEAVVDLREGFQEQQATMVKQARAMEEAARAGSEALGGQLKELVRSNAPLAAIRTKRGQTADADRLMLLAKEVRIAEKNYIRRDNDELRQAVIDRANEIRSLAEDLAGRVGGEAGQPLREAAGAAGAYRQAFERYTGLREDSQQKVDTMVAAARTMQEEAAALRDDEQSEQAAIRSGLGTTLLVTNGLAIAVVAGLAFVLTRMILGPINTVSTAVQEIQASGDFTRRIGVRGNDEIASMARSVDDLVEHQAALLRDINEQSSQVAAASEELSSTSDEITHSAQASSKRVEEVTNSAQEVNNVVQDVANNISEVSESATRTTTTTKEGMKAVDTAAEQINSLKSSSERVDEIIESIEAIAKKTDLLALNAAIEAANAGEQGKGFAVVADEVRKLAEQTSHATGQVNDIVGDLRSQSDSSVSAMGQVQERMKEVLEMIEHTDATANQIATAAEELAATMSETTDNMGEISSNVDQVAGSVTQIESAAQQLGELAHHLRSSVEKFRLG
jgi:methyl-accepting chemotaxis protein